MLFIGEFILERNCINVMCVARPLVKLQALQFIREFILERNHINVMYVARPLVYVKGLYFIREYIPERNHINVMCVERPLVKKQGVQFISTPVILPGKFHGERSLEVTVHGVVESDMTEQHTHT